MLLKRLEISGFKSFADKYTLDFASGISAIVGPNGSGKSNVSDAVRWVMGDQSMKGLRVHKGEDLIYSGANPKKGSGRASVKIVFDNQAKRFPIEFEELAVERKVFRDGENSYFINGSQVRLKDVSQILSHARLGLSGYTIINQGMGDSIVASSPRERLAMVEEALGLKPLQLKKEEAQNKLKETEINLAQAQNIIAELEPHMRFLRRQVDKLKKRDELQKNLDELKKKQALSILESAKNLREECENKIKNLEKDFSTENEKLDQLSQELERMKNVSMSPVEEDFSEDNKISTEHQKIILQLGQIEGRLAGFSADSPVLGAKNKERFVSWTKIKKEIGGVLEEVKSIHKNSDISLIQKSLDEVIKRLEVFLEEEQPKEAQQLIPEKDNALENLKNEKEALEEKLKSLNSQLEELRARRKKSQEESRQSYLGTFAKQEAFSQQKRKVDDLLSEKRSLSLNLENLLHKEKESHDFLKQFNIDETERGVQILSETELYDLQREIDKASARVELAQDVDPETEKEFNSTSERFNFLNTQVEDLNKSMESLKAVIVELEDQMREIFDSGFEKLRTEFKKFFGIIFTGGTADLLFRQDEEGDRGVEISAEIPGKRIKRVEALSGGERSLVSIALLFAIVAISEPPFLMLDEIDAPLDESNCRKFARILKELSAKTQFIVITHNRETMQAAGVLYGVTMQEGASSLLSMKLED